MICIRDLKSLKSFLVKKFLKKSVLLYFWSRSVDFIDFRVDTFRDTFCLGGQKIMSTYGYIQNGLPRKVLVLSQLFKTF